MPTVFEDKKSSTFHKIPKSCHYNIYIKTRKFTNIKSHRVLINKATEIKRQSRPLLEGKKKRQREG